MKKQDLTQARLKELLNYDPDTGIFTRKVKTCHFVNIGDIAGHLNSDGYIVIRVLSSLHRAHRLAFLYMNGKFPDEHVDHINGARSNNKWLNLRECTRGENYQNQTKAKTNNKSSGYLGVEYIKSTEKYRSHIVINKKKKHIGCYNTAEEAHQAYIKEKRKIHPFGTI